MMHWQRMIPAVCAAAVLAMATGLSAAPKEMLITSFESGEGPTKGDGKIVQEQHSDGKSSYKVEHPGSTKEGGGKTFTGIWIEDRATLKQFKDYLLFKIDIYNPQDTPIKLNIRADDGKSKDFGTRFQDERGNVAAPGWSTYELNLTGLTRSNSKNYANKERLDVSDLRVVKITVSGDKPVTLYFDNLRLEASGLPVVEGLKAIDFGPSKSDVYPGFEACSEINTWNDKPETQFGWVNPLVFDNVYMPDSLSGDYASGDEFRMKLPDGKYVVHVCLDPFGIWGSYPRYGYRKVTVNGSQVLSQTMNASEFLQNCYFLHEDEEDLPGRDLWAKYILPRNVPRQFEATVTGGVLSLKIDSDQKYGRYIQYLVVYPESKKAEGQAWFKALDDIRHEKFNKGMIVQLPPKETLGAKPTPADTACGFIPFVRSTEVYCYVNSAPAADEVGKPVTFAAAQGQREGALLGLYPLADVKGVGVTVSDLAGPAGAKIPASAVQVRKVRNFLKRDQRTRIGKLLPYILQDFKAVDIAPGVTRGIWLTLVVPDNAAAGEYTGTIKVGAGDKAASVPVKLTVYPFSLDKVTDITFSATGARTGIPEYWPELEALSWKHAEIVMKDMADHGLNAITGGPGAPLTAVKDGKPVIDYTDMDRWFELARKYGLTMPGDGYQGCDVKGIPNDTKKDCIANNDKNSQKKFGVSYEELIKIVYEDVEKHAVEKNWPKRSYSFLDEPRPEFGNIESALELIKVRVKAAPNTRFSGYYSTGLGRDEYFKVMPVSITHLNETALKLTKEAGKEIWVYDGSRTRSAGGRWSYAAAKAGLKGYLTNGYLYVNSDPYFDFSDDEASWCVVYPSRNGVNDSVVYERLAEGINDYRYLSTLERLIAKAKADNKAPDLAKAAGDFVAKTVGSIDLGEKGGSAALTGPQYDEFRQTAAGHIIALGKALGEIK